jgi:hypothetical protein
MTRDQPLQEDKKLLNGSRAGNVFDGFTAVVHEQLNSLKDSQKCFSCFGPAHSFLLLLAFFFVIDFALRFVAYAKMDGS